MSAVIIDAVKSSHAESLFKKLVDVTGEMVNVGLFKSRETAQDGQICGALNAITSDDTYFAKFHTPHAIEQCARGIGAYEAALEVGGYVQPYQEDATRHYIEVLREIKTYLEELA